LVFIELAIPKAPEGWASNGWDGEAPLGWFWQPMFGRSWQINARMAKLDTNRLWLVLRGDGKQIPISGEAMLALDNFNSKIVRHDAKIAWQRTVDVPEPTIDDVKPWWTKEAGNKGWWPLPAGNAQPAVVAQTDGVEQWMEMAKTFRDVQLSPSTALSGKNKELVGLAVAAQVPCRFCVIAHTEFAKLNGATDAEISEAIAMASFTRSMSTLLNGLQIDEAQFRHAVSEIARRLIAKREQAALNEPHDFLGLVAEIHDVPAILDVDAVAELLLQAVADALHRLAEARGRRSVAAHADGNWIGHVRAFYLIFSASQSAAKSMPTWRLST